MSDVRLVATNPEDSSLVPVACNSRGEMMIVEPTIEKISNDVEIEGDLTVTGTINGDNGGSGLPAPGPEGSILAIENGAPAWVGKSDLCAPPPPDPAAVTFFGYDIPGGGQTAAQPIDINGNLVTSSDYNQYMMDGPGWSAQPDVIDSQYGIGKLAGQGTDSVYRCQVGKAFGKVLSIGFRWKYSRNVSSPGYSSLELDLVGESYAQIINWLIEGQDDPDPQTGLVMGSFEILLTRDDFTFDFGVSGKAAGSNGMYPLVMHWFSLSDPTTFMMSELIRKQEKKRQRREALLKVGSTTDIDLLR